MKLSKNSIGIIYLLTTAIIWGASFISQYLGGSAIGSFAFTFYRCVFACITICIMILVDNFFRYKIICFFSKNENIKKTIINSFICGITLFFAMTTQQIGVEITDTAKSGLIASIEVVCVPILMCILYKKKIKLFTWFFILLAMFGIMLLSANSLSGFNIGDLWVFISTILYSITIIQVPKYVEDIEPFKFSFFRFVIVCVCSFLFSIFLKENIFAKQNLIIALPSIFFSGVFASGVAYTLQILGQKYCEPVLATLLMSLEGVFAAIFGWIILGQTLNFIQIIAIIITFISIAFVELSESKI